MRTHAVFNCTLWTNTTQTRQGEYWETFDSSTNSFPVLKKHFLRPKSGGKHPKNMDIQLNKDQGCL